MAAKKGKVLVGMSGGVDSSVCAWLLHHQGYECVGVSMKLFQGMLDGEQADSRCCSVDDIEDARAICRRIGIPFHVFNFRDDFREHVLSRFVQAYEEGRTPNPCVDCNRYIKFAKFLERALQLGYDYIATGHYARIEQQHGRYALRKAVDTSKDQSYVLCGLTQHQLAHTLLPLGDYTKAEIRAIAEQAGLVTATKKDSQDLCFVHNGDYAAALYAISGQEPKQGDFVDTKGNVLGRHKGIIHYTIGQRKGLGVPGADRLYVLDKRAEDNTVVLGTLGDLPKSELLASDFNWIGDPTTRRAKAMIRYNKPEAWADVAAHPDGTVRLVFDEPQAAISPGQTVALYQDDYVLGGGTIF